MSLAILIQIHNADNRRNLIYVTFVLIPIPWFFSKLSRYSSATISKCRNENFVSNFIILYYICLLVYCGCCDWIFVMIPYLIKSLNDHIILAFHSIIAENVSIFIKKISHVKHLYINHFACQKFFISNICTVIR